VAETVVPLRADVCVAGAGLVGLYNALQYARRGFSVVLVDELTSRQQASYKVGESLLVFANAFLRTVGDLDDVLGASFEKQGFWMAYNMEGRTAFDDSVSEWGFLATLPERWRAEVTDQKLVRAMAGDVQIVRPEIEAALRERVRAHPSITFLDCGLAREVDLGEGDADHRIGWRSRSGADSGEIAARWLIDCSGRARWLARRFGHDIPLTDGFRTSAVWGQFRGCTDDIFDQVWNYRFPDGQRIRRDLDTVHLWGDGYWIWLIRLTGQRISVGVTFDRERAPEDASLRELFWKVIGRYPLLDFLTEDDVLEFRAYRDVQYLTDTYVSAKRYALAGDAASIIDAFYSQGLSLSLSTSWHTANIAERDLRDGVLDTGYVDRVNRASQADWRLMRCMVRHKYGRALQDSRFFVFDHFLDYLILAGTILTRYRISRWLVGTGGRTDAETPAQQRLRKGLERQLFLSQSAPWHRFDPLTFARLIEAWHCGNARRARWRLDHGVRLRPAKAVLRADAAIPAVWRLPFLNRRRRPDLTPPVVKEPRFMRVRGTEYRPPLLAMAGAVVLMVNLACLTFDIADTALRWVWYGLRRLVRRPHPAVNSARGSGEVEGAS
jgi:2-polyprenyl-6-methoxyphenol hydroxylase-like FAD-dependent oxidoreductase